MKLSIRKFPWVYHCLHSLKCKLSSSVPKISNSLSLCFCLNVSDQFARTHARTHTHTPHTHIPYTPQTYTHTHHTHTAQTYTPPHTHTHTHTHTHHSQTHTHTHTHIYIYIYSLTTGIRSEKCVFRRFRRCANLYLHKPRWYSVAYCTPRLYGIARLQTCTACYCTEYWRQLKHNGKYCNILIL